MPTTSYIAKPLTATQLTALGRGLRARHAELVEEDERALASLEEVRIAREDSSTDDEHDPEGPTLTNEWSRLTGLREELEAKFDSVNRALARVDAGTYGVCERCGSPIGKARLEARPEASLCINCARERDDAR